VTSSEGSLLDRERERKVEKESLWWKEEVVLQAKEKR
jgi:hypothetical protein